eukprot:3248413-Rhodomonas_salina.1
MVVTETSLPTLGNNDLPRFPKVAGLIASGFDSVTYTLRRSGSGPTKAEPAHERALCELVGHKASHSTHDKAHTTPNIMLVYAMPAICRALRERPPGSILVAAAQIRTLEK